MLIPVKEEITERKEIDERLLRSEARYRAMFEEAGDGILIRDRHFNYLDANPRLLTMLGYTLDEFRKLKNDNLIHPEDLVAYPTGKVSERLQAGETVQIERRFRRKDGRFIPVQLSVRMVDSVNGIVLSLVRDFSAQKQAEEELRQHNQNLEKQTAFANEMLLKAKMADSAKSQFLANMSHEIRTPLNGVIGMADLLLGTALTAEQRRYAETARSSAGSLLAILNDILDFSKIESGRLDLEEIDFDLRVLLDDLAGMLAVRAHDRGLELTCSVEPDVPSALRGDPTRLRQVLANLAGNAIKFTAAGEVSIRATLERKTEHQAVIRFAVKDTGIGIAAEKQDLIFESFSQADSSITRRFGGTGLGLAISRRLVERMDGQLKVASVEGQGSEFWFIVRFDRSATQLNMRPSQVSSQDLRGARILVADDNATSRNALQAQLQTWGGRVETSGGGATAIQTLKSAAENGAPFQAAILDMQMPEIGGETLGRMIRAEPGLSALRLIALTSLGRPGDASRLKQAGFDGDLTKPVRESDLHNTILALLAERPSAADHQPVLARHSACETLQANLRVLVADDNLTNREVALGILRLLGLNAQAVENGREVLATLEAEDWDLVVLDMQMPEMDGYETARRIRDTGSPVRNHLIPIIAMTACAFPDDRQRCLDAGMDDYVAKPVSAKAFSAAVERWLPKWEFRSEKRLASAGTGEMPGAAIDGRTGFKRADFERRLIGDTDLIRSVINGFFQDMPLQINALQHAIDATDAGESTRMAHAIKGAAANMGGETLRQTAAEMEQMGRRGDLGSMQRRLPDLKRDLGSLVDAVRTSFADLLG